MSKELIVDRFAGDGVDVLMLTLDAGVFLERSMRSLYAEVPVARLLVCDGGSKDQTIPILKNFPRVELHIRPDIQTTGKGLEFLLTLARTEWVMLTDADLTFPKGWYNEMCKYQVALDAVDSKRIHAYEFYREDLASTKMEMRPLMTSPQIGKLEALRNFRVDDDYMWRITDIAMRQVVEKNGYKYGKVSSTFHFHHTAEEIKYSSVPSKAATKIVFTEPREVVVNAESWMKRLIDTARAYVKYVDPDLPYVKDDQAIDNILLPLLSRDWVVKHGAKWVPRFDGAVQRARRRYIQRKLVEMGLRVDTLCHKLDAKFHRYARRFLVIASTDGS